MTTLGIVMDPIGSIHIEKDSSFAMLLAAQARGVTLHYMELPDLGMRGSEAVARVRPLVVRDDPSGWYTLGEPEERLLGELDLVLMRKDPPVDTAYLHATLVLDEAQRAGARVVNDPRALRDVNEKLAATWFPDYCPPTVVSAQAQVLRGFLAAERDCVIKPLDAMGGQGVFRLKPDDPNVGVVIETLTRHGTRMAMMQRFIPDVVHTGDKRILLVEGKPVSHALARLPREGETRANLAAGGRGEVVPLDERERALAMRVGRHLVTRGIVFAGLDVIGGFLTEINITSPTCIREIERGTGLDVAGELIECLRRE